METDIKDFILPTSDAFDVSVTEHTAPLPAGEGLGVGLWWGVTCLESCALIAIKYCVFLLIDGNRYKRPYNANIR